MTSVDNNHEKIVIIGATNQQNLIDSALQSRLKVKIPVPEMSNAERLDFLLFQAKNYSIDIKTHQYIINEISRTLKARDRRSIKSIFDQAILISERRHHDVILKSDLQEAVEEISQNTFKNKEQRRLAEEEAYQKWRSLKVEMAKDRHGDYVIIVGSQSIYF